MNRDNPDYDDGFMSWYCDDCGVQGMAPCSPWCHNVLLTEDDMITVEITYPDGSSLDMFPKENTGFNHAALVAIWSDWLALEAQWNNGQIEVTHAQG